MQLSSLFPIFSVGGTTTFHLSILHHRHVLSHIYFAQNSQRIFEAEQEEEYLPLRYNGLLYTSSLLNHF
jgi:hypothetical protein